MRPGASEAEIKAAYHRLAQKYHPDRNPGFQDEANEKQCKTAIAAADASPSATDTFADFIEDEITCTP